MTTVAIADDHTIFCDSLGSLINSFENYRVIWTAVNGNKAIERMKAQQGVPDILLLDINMPEKNGIEVAEWLYSSGFDKTHILALTMENDENSILKMLQFGVRGYLLKTIGTEELHHALDAIVHYGFYYTPLITKQIGLQVNQKSSLGPPALKPREQELLQLMCTDLSYAEIARKMFLSESTVDTYRGNLFEKFQVKNRIGLLLKANSLGIVKL